MNTAYGVLVIILSITLAVFLVLAIYIAVQVIKLMKTLREIADRTERVVTSAEAAALAFKKVSGPVGLLHFVRSVMDSVSEHKQKSKGD